MKESYSRIVDIRRRVFAEVARIAYNDLDIESLEDASYRLFPGEVAQFRESMFRERAIADERIRLAMGMPIREIGVYKRVTDGFDKIDIDTNAYEKPLVNVIKFACEACPTKSFYVTDNCRRCMAHPCTNVCPVNAVSIEKNRAHIDTTKCVKCGRCRDTCPYHAIVDYDRPCSAACGVGAIKSDEYGRADIEEDKCVACGRCIAECPFGAIADKSQIYQVVKAIKSGKKLYGAIAPSFIGQFGLKTTPKQVFEAIKQLGFEDVIEVGLGADLTTLHEAHEYLKRVPEEIPFMGTSCCFSWALMIKNMFPELKEQISDSGSPMRYTAEHIKKMDKDAVVVFIGPCTSKKLEALDTNIKSSVDFVLTFEELMGMFVAKGVEPLSIEIEDDIEDSSALGRGYPVAGGVAAAVKKVAESIDPDREILIEGANSLSECVKMLKFAKAGKKNGYLLEGMACPGGCIAGVGTIQSTTRVKKNVDTFMKNSKYKDPFENENIKEYEFFD